MADDPASTTKRRWSWFALLVAIGGIGIYAGAPGLDVLRRARSRLGEVPITAIAIVIGGAVGLVITEALRIRVIARLVGATVTRRDAWDAAVANHVMTAVTPQVGLGEPTVAYLLNKRGVPWDRAVAIPFIKFSTSLTLLFALGAVFAAAGFGPMHPPWLNVALAMWFSAVAAFSGGVIALCTRPVIAQRFCARIMGWLARRRLLRGERWQARIARIDDVVARAIERIATLRAIGWRGATALLAAHLIYYVSYIAPLVGLAYVLGDPPLVTVSLRAVVYLCFVLAMPIPAGPGEAAATLFFGDLVPPADAIVIVAVFRAATFYLQLAIGALYLPVRAVVHSSR